MTDAIALVAVIDVLCAPHRQETIEHGWPIPGDLMDLRDQCEHCRDRMNQLSRTHGTSQMRAVPFHTDDNELWIQIATIHEAGHAVLGIRGGHRLLDVSIKPDRLARCARSTRTGSSTNTPSPGSSPGSCSDPSPLTRIARGSQCGEALPCEREAGRNTPVK